MSIVHRIDRRTRRPVWPAVFAEMKKGGEHPISDLEDATGASKNNIRATLLLAEAAGLVSRRLPREPRKVRGAVPELWRWHP